MSFSEFGTKSGGGLFFCLFLKWFEQEVQLQAGRLHLDKILKRTWSEDFVRF